MKKHVPLIRVCMEVKKFDKIDFLFYKFKKKATASHSAVQKDSVVGVGMVLRARFAK